MVQVSEPSPRAGEAEGEASHCNNSLLLTARRCPEVLEAHVGSTMSPARPVPPTLTGASSLSQPHGMWSGQSLCFWEGLQQLEHLDLDSSGEQK